MPHFGAALDDAPIQPGDVLLVESSANTEPFALQWNVDSAGNVHLPYSGPWHVTGKTPSEVAKELTRYFSVHREVTFKVERISGEFYPKTQAPPEKTRSKAKG